MMRVFEAQHHAEAHFVQGLLHTAGIKAEVRGESLLTTVGGGSAIPGMRPTVWILEDGQLAQARGIVAAFSAGEGAPRHAEGPWRCSTCGEVHEPQFASCWKCGTPVPGAGVPPSP